MKRVGFWAGAGLLDGLLLPDPRKLVDAAWDPLARAAVVAHLRSGDVCESYFGYSWCRFNCGRREEHMGNKDLTDGVYVWPEGFVHYVETHLVRPPPEFVAHVLRRPR